MGPKTAVAFDIFMADFKKRLLIASPYKPLVWKRFIDDIFHCGTFQWKKFTILSTSRTRLTLQSSLLAKCHPNALFFLILRFSKDLAFQLIKFLTYKHIFSLSTHFSSCHPSNCKKGFIKGEALLLLRTNSIRENFEQSKRDFEHRLCQRGYPLTLVKEILTEVKFTDRKEALHNKT